MSTPPYVDLPAGVHAIRVDVRGGSLAALTVRPEDSKGMAVLVPGFTGSKEDFLPVMAPLAEAGWTVAAIDQLGQHESKGPDDDASYTENALAQRLADFVQVWAPGVRVNLVGHSLGGLIVRRALMLTPEVAGSATLLCSGPGRLPAPKQAELAPLIDALTVVPIEIIGAHKLAADRLNDVVPPSREVLAFLKRRFEGNNPHALRAMGRLLCEVEDTTAEMAIVAEREGIRLLVARGSEDDVWPHTEQAQMARTLGARYEVIPAAKHSPAAENPIGTTAVLAGFWSNR